VAATRVLVVASAIIGHSHFLVATAVPYHIGCHLAVGIVAIAIDIVTVAIATQLADTVHTELGLKCLGRFPVLRTCRCPRGLVALPHSPAMREQACPAVVMLVKFLNSNNYSMENAKPTGDTLAHQHLVPSSNVDSSQEYLVEATKRWRTMGNLGFGTCVNSYLVLKTSYKIIYLDFFI
jgi:hypothetical protein